ncbi:DUF2855 family protein [Paraglaciecola sp. 20A4]|uniref:DUF2855 family protein n=1 Tax=Paraglaciecola sp. 20A4 TaxID=2687288 RepID=UPI00140C9546|nr:DUF2855 family protein [Paraglaciecola sp. 20A4]
MSGDKLNDTQIDSTEVWVNKADVAQTKIVHGQLDTTQLLEGQAILQLNHFGFSANNVTYAVTGDKMGYWGFFPADDQWGIVPVWGFGTVIASKHPKAQVGEVVYGYFPMGTHLVVNVDKANDVSFFDTHPQRVSSSPVYDNYLRCAQDPAYQQDSEAWLLNYRPLFMTSFVLDDYVGEHINDNVTTVLLTSASSKTAYGCAHLLMKHKAQRGGHYRVVGLTSATNKALTESFGCYDDVLEYTDIDKLSKDGESWVLDFAGNKQLLLDLQDLLGDKLTKEVFIGATDVKSQSNKPKGKLHGELFFAPHQVKKRTEEWTREGFNERYAKAWGSFSAHMQDKIKVVEYNGAQSVVDLYKLGLAGNLNNEEINVVSF